jgi:hypothetical protein
MESEDFPAILIYVRGTKCHHPDSDSFLTVTPSGYRAHEEHCALVKSTLDLRPASIACGSDARGKASGGPGTYPWCAP